MANFDTKVEQLLSSSRLLLNHPGSAQLGSDLYSNVHNSQIELIRRQAYHGRYKATANSLTLGGTSSFYLQPGTIFNQIYVAGQLALPRYGRVTDFWMLKAIERIEIIVSGNSSIQSLQLSGEGHFMAAIAMCSNEEKRKALAKASPFEDSYTAAINVWGACPLVIPWSSPELAGAFALDSSTLQSQIAINIRWKQGYQIVGGDTTAAVTPPAAFSDLYLRAVQVEMLDNQFALSRELASKPNMTYSIPSLYLQSFEQKVTVTAGTEFSVTLTSMPTGMLQAILLSVVPDGWSGSAGTQTYLHPFGVDMDSIRMLYNGQEIYRFEHRNEGDLLQALKEDGGDGEYRVNNSLVLARAGGAYTGLQYRHKVYTIPFANEISKVLRERRHEHTQDFSGASLQLYCDIAAAQRVATSIVNEQPAGTVAGNGVVNPTAASTYTLTVVYVLNALVEVNQRSVSLEL
jgi:hypothetical protein